MIGTDIQVTVLAIQGGRVRLGFSGSPEVPIHRAELPRRIVGAGPASAGSPRIS